MITALTSITDSIKESVMKYFTKFDFSFYREILAYSTLFKEACKYS